MEKIEVWKSIPESFFVPDLKSKITWECSEMVCTLLKEKAKHTLTYGAIEYVVWEINRHWDIFLSSSSNYSTIMLAQRWEIILFAYLIKFAVEVWEIENLIHPEKWNLLWFIQAFKNELDDEYRFDVWDILVTGPFNEYNSKKDYHKISKFPHYDWLNYDLHIDIENKTLVFRETSAISQPSLPGFGIGEFRIHKTDIIYILRCLISLNAECGGRMNPWRYEDALKFIFSDAFKVEYRKYFS